MVNKLQGDLFKERGPGFWKFNSELLGDKEFIDVMNNMLLEADKKYDYINNKGLKWDAIKCEIRSVTISYSKMKAKKSRNKELVT